MRRLVPELDRDYSLYLVTDSTKPILGDRNLVDVVEEAIKGGKSLPLLATELVIDEYQA